MKLVGPLLIAIVAAGLAWIATMSLWVAASSYLSRLTGMTGGDVEGPLIALFGGGLLLIGLLALAGGGLFTGTTRRLLAYGGIGLAVIAEWFFATYLDEQKRFVSPEYERLPGPRPTPLVDDATYYLHSAMAVGLHIAALVLLAALVFLLVAAARRYFLGPKSASLLARR